MKQETQGVASAAISGIGWNYVGSLASTISSLVIGTVLARILGPGPFGQAIVATTIFSLANFFVDGGFSQALIQQKELAPDTVRRTFTCQVLSGVCLTALVYLAAPVIVRLFHVPSATPVVRALSLLLTLQSFGLVSAALLRREMRFRVVQYAGLASYLVAYLLLGVPLAVYGAGVWSLVAAYLAQAAINAGMLYASARHPLAPCFRLPPRSIAVFGGTIIANNLVNWGHFNLDNLAASYRGPVALGLYGRACNLAYQPCNALANGLQSVLLSSAAKMQGRKEVLGQLALVSMVLALGLLGPAYATFVCSPATVITGLYGPKWSAAIPLMVPLALAMPLFGCISLLNPILCGMGRPALEFWPQAISCALASVAYFAAVRVSLVAVGWALLAVMSIRFLLTAGMVFSTLGVSWVEAVSAGCGRLMFSAAFAMCTWSLDRSMISWSVAAGPRLLVLFSAAVCLMGASIWFASAFVFGRASVRFLLQYSAHLPPAYVRQLRRPRKFADLIRVPS